MCFIKSEGMQFLLREGRLAMGCMDTYLVWRLTGGQMHLTEASSASSTGLYNPFVGGWGTTILKLIGFPLGVLPDVVDPSGVGQLGDVSEEVFGFPLKIGAVVCGLMICLRISPYCSYLSWPIRRPQHSERHAWEEWVD